MGIILLPYYIGVLIINFFCIRLLMEWWDNEALPLSMVLLGMLISLLIILGIVLSYYVKENVYALSPLFRIPFCLFYVPGIIAYLLLKIQSVLLGDLSKSIVVSIVFSGLLTLIFRKYLFGILDFLKIKKHY